MNKVIALMLIFTMCGCSTAYQMASAKAVPREGERFDLRVNDFKIVQVCKDSVHVRDSSLEDGLRICIVPINNNYVTDSYLRSGVYEYVGPYTYTTMKDKNGNEGTHTVRLFKEVVEKGEDQPVCMDQPMCEKRHD